MALFLVFVELIFNFYRVQIKKDLLLQFKVTNVSLVKKKHI